MTIEPKADARTDAVADPHTFLLICLASRGKIVAHLCERHPVDRHDIARCSLGPGVVTMDGGTFQITRSGVICCIVYVIDGRMIVTDPPGAKGVSAREGQRAQIGPIVTRRKSA